MSPAEAQRITGRCLCAAVRFEIDRKARPGHLLSLLAVPPRERLGVRGECVGAGPLPALRERARRDPRVRIDAGKVSRLLLALRLARLQPPRVGPRDLSDPAGNARRRSGPASAVTLLGRIEGRVARDHGRAPAVHGRRPGGRRLRRRRERRARAALRGRVRFRRDRRRPHAGLRPPGRSRARARAAARGAPLPRARRRAAGRRGRGAHRRSRRLQPRRDRRRQPARARARTAGGRAFAPEASASGRRCCARASSAARRSRRSSSCSATPSTTRASASAPRRRSDCAIAASVFDPSFFVLELAPGALAGISGWVRYPEAFERL